MTGHPGSPSQIPVKVFAALITRVISQKLNFHPLARLCLSACLQNSSFSFTQWSNHSIHSFQECTTQYSSSKCPFYHPFHSITSKQINSINKETISKNHSLYLPFFIHTHFIYDSFNNPPHPLVTFIIPLLIMLLTQHFASTRSTLEHLYINRMHSLPFLQRG